MKKRIVSEIRTVDKLARETQRRIEDEASKAENEENAQFDSVKTNSSSELATLRKKLQETVSSNRESEQELRKVSKCMGWDVPLLSIQSPSYRKHLNEKQRQRTGYRSLIMIWESNK